MNQNNNYLQTNRFFLITLCMIFLLQVPPILAQDPSPIGKWKTISDKTGKVTSMVTITQEANMLSGKVTELFRKPGQNPKPTLHQMSR